MQLEECVLTPALEDYLEMIFRISSDSGSVKIRDLSKALNVRPPSASKMVRQLDSLGFLTAQRYGDITLTEKGRLEGEFLLYRHNVIHEFLCLLNKCTNQLEETEKIEHFLDKKTVGNLDKLVRKMKNKREV